MKFKATLFLSLLVLSGTSGYAQLSKNPNKFLGNITTAYSVRSDFSNYWNQLTPENETKWASVEGTRDVYNWSAVDREYQYCKDHNIPFKFHTLIWGGQYPTWMNGLSQSEQLAEITEWFDEAAKRYPDVQYIDVVNEALSGHNPAPFKNALGGDGASGYDWIVKSFIMARERWPKAVLIYNDFNTFQWDTDRYIDLLKKIKAAGAPVDVAGCQAHDLNNMSGANFKTVLEKIHNQTGLPIAISEYDINLQDDQLQLTRFKEQIPVMWEADYVVGVTLWGYIYGSTWVDYSGLIRNGVERPALQWLREYMLTDVAIYAKSPLVSGDEYANITTSSALVKINTEATITAKANSTKNTIAKIEVYVNDLLMGTSTETTVSLKWTPTVAGNYTFKMKVLSGTGEIIFVTTCTAKAYEPSTPFKATPIALPGILEAEDFDNGVNGVAYSDTDDKNDGDASFRADTGVDIVNGNGGKALGYAAVGEWLLYTVNVKSEQVYNWKATVSSGVTGSAFKIYMGTTDITGRIQVPQTASSSWSTYTQVSGKTTVPLPAGTYQLRLAIEGANCNIDNVTFSSDVTGVEDIKIATFDGMYEVFSIAGVRWGTVKINNGNLSGLRGKYPKGIYILRKQDGSGEAKTVLIN